MAEEILVAEAVRAAAADGAVLDPSVVEEAVTAAVRAHLAGASVAEACEVGAERLAHSDRGRSAPARGQ